MENVNVFIIENVKKIGNDAHVAPSIPEKKLNNAIKAFKCESFYKSILAIYDDTFFGSSKEGLVFTGEKMIFSKGKPIEFIYSEISSVEYVKDVSTNENGVESISEYVIITKGEKKYELRGLESGNFNYEEFGKLLDNIVTKFDDYKEEDQLKTISEMSSVLKVSYLKIIINMTFADDDLIDEKELTEIFLLMARLELERESRFNIRSYITEITKENILPVEELLDVIKSNIESSHYKSLMISLAKDMINVYFSTKKTFDRDFEFLDKYKGLFELSDIEVSLAYETVESDYKFLNENLSNDEIKKLLSELTAKAASAGVPLAAVYISGSVIGMSAAGITSGLASLGLGMGMTGGLAVIGVIGVISYKGVKQLTGANEIDKYKTREIMLNDIIKQTQKTISLTIDDINYIVQKLNDAIFKDNTQTKKIKKLMTMMTQFQKALKNIDNKTDKYQNSVNRLNCPVVLDVNRLDSITSQFTDKVLYDFIISNYEEKIIKIDGNNMKKVVLKENIETEVLEKMVEIFERLEYFDMSNILKGKASSIMKGIFG